MPHCLCFVWCLLRDALHWQRAPTEIEMPLLQYGGLMLSKEQDRSKLLEAV
jgi:hypothetical protein